MAPKQGFVFDVAITGDKALLRKLNSLDRKAQRSAISPAFRSSSQRIHARLIRNINNRVVSVLTGRLIAAWQSVKIRVSIRQGGVRAGFDPPSRAAAGIEANDESYYPYAIEYGHGDVPAHPYIRPAVDESAADERAAIAAHIGRRLIGLWRR